MAVEWQEKFCDLIKKSLSNILGDKIKCSIMRDAFDPKIWHIEVKKQAETTYLFRRSTLEDVPSHWRIVAKDIMTHILNSLLDEQIKKHLNHE